MTTANTGKDGEKRTLLAPLKITCTQTNCAEDQHCYLATQKMVRAKLGGSCRECGVRLVDWTRVHARDLDDAAYTFRMLKTEFIRHHFWHTPIDQRALNPARRKGVRGMRAAAEHRIRSSVAAAEPFRDGQQSPVNGTARFYAKHATATCCRRCIEEWHAIPPHRALTEDEIQYLTQLVTLYIGERLPDLTEEGEHVPPMRARAPRGRQG
jgi:hypothetical protein